MKGFKGIIIMIVVLAALAGGVVLVRRNQETRRGAFNNEAEIFTQGSIPSNLNVGSTWTIQLYIDTADKTINAVNITVDPVDKSIFEVVKVKNNSELFTYTLAEEVLEQGAHIAGLISKPVADLPKGIILLGSITMRATKAGTATLQLGTKEVAMGEVIDGNNKLNVTFRGEGYPIGSSGGNTVWVSFEPNAGYVKVGQEQSIKVKMNSGDKKITGMKINLAYTKALTEIISFQGRAGYSWSGTVKDASNADDTLGILSINGAVDIASTAVGGTGIELGTITFKARAKGIDGFTRTQNNNQVVDVNSQTLALVADSTTFEYDDEIKCEDSDGGQKYSTAGTTRIINVSQNSEDSKTDTCEGSVLTEYYCDGEFTRLSEEHTCASGCTDGACTGGVGDTDPPGVGDTDPPGVGDTDPPGVGDTDPPVVPSQPPAPTGAATDSVINFKVSFAGLSGEAKCWQNPMVTLTAMGADGVLKVYKNVPITLDEAKTGPALTVYKGSYRMPGFTKKDHVAIFIKGPQHAQVKYGEDDQKAFFNKPGGELTLTNTNDSPEYDFSGYPILAGDFTGESNVPDGKIDGRDFSYIKANVSALKQVAANTYGDLNGDCAINAFDLGTFMKSFNERMDQMY